MLYLKSFQCFVDVFIKLLVIAISEVSKPAVLNELHLFLNGKKMYNLISNDMIKIQNKQ